MTSYDYAKFMVAKEITEAYLKDQPITQDLGKHMINRIGDVVRDAAGLCGDDLSRAALCNAAVVSLLAMGARYLQQVAIKTPGAPQLPFPTACTITQERLKREVALMLAQMATDPAVKNMMTGNG